MRAMTSISTRLRWASPEGLILSLMAVVGVAMTSLLIIDKPIIYLAVIPGLAVALAIVRAPILGLYLLTLALPLDLAGRLISITTTFNLSLAWVFTLLTLGAWIVDSLARRQPVFWPPEMWVWVAYLVVGGISLLDALEFDRGVEEIVRTVQNMMFFLLIMNMVRTRQQLLNVCALLTIATVGTFAYAITQKFFPTNVFEERGLDLLREGAVTFGVERGKVDTQGYEAVERVTGTTAHSGMLALNCAYTLPFIMAYLRLKTALIPQALGWLAVVVTFAAFGITLSRSGFLTLAFATMMLVFVGLLQVTGVRLLAVLLLACLAVPFLPAGYIERVLSPASYLPSNSDSLNGRLEMWAGSLEAIFDHPFTGLGIGNEHGIFVLHYWKPELRDQLGTVMNTFLQIGMEVGVLGVIVFTIFVVMIFRRVLAARRHFAASGDATMVALGSALFVVMASCVVSWMSVEFLRAGFKNIWLLMACIVAYHRIACVAPAAHSDSRVGFNDMRVARA